MFGRKLKVCIAQFCHKNLFNYLIFQSLLNVIAFGGSISEEDAKNKAIEAWNTWRGRYVTPTPDMFCEVNYCNSCSEIIAKELYNNFPENEFFIKCYQMHTNGALISPWPYFDNKNIVF